METVIENKEKRLLLKNLYSKKTGTFKKSFPYYYSNRKKKIVDSQLAW